MSSEEMKKREKVIEKFNQISCMQDGYALAALEFNAMYKETTGESFLKKAAENMRV